MIDDQGVSCEIVLKWKSLEFTECTSTLVKVMAWCHQPTNKCWLRSLSSYGVIRLYWVNFSSIKFYLITVQGPLVLTKNNSNHGMAKEYSRFTVIFFPSGEQPEQCELAHMLYQPTDSCRAIFHKYCRYTKNGAIITNLTLWNLWGHMSKYHNGDIWSMD